MQQQPVLFFSRGISGKVDADKGIITGVAVLTEGEARGHNEWVDSTTLKEVKASAEAFSGGVRVKLNHYGGVESIIGSIDNFRIEGKKLLGDLHLLKQHDSFKQVIELAQSMPEICGLSISFTGEPSLIDKVRYARCTELYSIDLVDQPAANPDGLFHSCDPSIIQGLSIDELRTILSAVDSRATDRMDDKTFLERLRGAFGGTNPTDETVPKTAFTLLETGHRELVTRFTKLETDLSSAQSKVVSLEAEKKTAVEALEARNKDFAKAVTEHAGKEAATVLTKLSIKPIEMKAENQPAPDAKTLLQEYNELQDPAKKTEFYAKYGSHNLVNNIRKPAE